MQRARQRELEAASLLQSQLAVRTAVAGNFALMALNVVMAVRGVQIWHLLQRVGFEGWIHTIASQLPWTRRVARVFNVATMPVRQALRPLRAPFRPLGAWRAAAVQREVAAREAAAAAARMGPFTYAMKKTFGIVSLAERKAWGVLSFADRKFRQPLYYMVVRS